MFGPGANSVHIALKRRKVCGGKIMFMSLPAILISTCVNKWALQQFQFNPVPVIMYCTVLLVNGIPEQTTLLFWSTACSVMSHWWPPAAGCALHSIININILYAASSSLVARICRPYICYGVEWSKDKTQAAESIKWRPQNGWQLCFPGPHKYTFLYNN